MSSYGEDRRCAVRVKYDLSYWAAEFDGQSIPARSRFRQVKGCDLSPVGISFYADAPPKSDQLVLMFEGQRNRSYMLVQVIHQRVCPLEGKRHYLLGCQFVRALSAEDDDR